MACCVTMVRLGIVSQLDIGGRTGHATDSRCFSGGTGNRTGKEVQILADGTTEEITGTMHNQDVDRKETGGYIAGGSELAQDGQ